MDMQFNDGNRGGPVVMVTGANSGFGHHLTKALIEEGYRVAALDISTSNFPEETAETDDHVRWIECDVTDQEDVDAAVKNVVETWERIDILVNNAATLEQVAPFSDRTLDGIRREFDVNVYGYLRLIQAVLPVMCEQDQGIIHNVGSPVDRLGLPSHSGYTSTKGAIYGFSRSLRLELREENVSCTVVYPPMMNTRSADHIDYPGWLKEDPAEVARKIANKIRSTGPVIYPDLSTRIAVCLFRSFPWIWERFTAKYVGIDRPTTPNEPETGDDVPERTLRQPVD